MLAAARVGTKGYWRGPARWAARLGLERQYEYETLLDPEQGSRPRYGSTSAEEDSAVEEAGRSPNCLILW
jgi:hypothetical protein